MYSKKPPFLDKVEVPISNNLAENAIRPFTLGRKNWLFILIFTYSCGSVAPDYL